MTDNHAKVKDVEEEEQEAPPPRTGTVSLYTSSALTLI